MRTVEQVLHHRAAADFVGRQEELVALTGCLVDSGPLVAFVHGIAGIGKTSLLTMFCGQARERGVTVVRLDCRNIEPTGPGFLAQISATAGLGETEELSQSAIADRLSSVAERVVLVLDTYEMFRILDTWMRQVFAPSLGSNVRLVFASREPPMAAWRSEPGWRGLFRTIHLGPLAENEAQLLLQRGGMPANDAVRLNRFTRGHPLALLVASAAAAERSTQDLEQATVGAVMDVLTRLYLSELSPLTRRVVDAASVVRRTSVPLLGAMLPDISANDAFETLRMLPFVEMGTDGLFLHEVVQQVASANLRATDPNRHRTLRRAAWAKLRYDVRDVAAPELWRYTADMLYLLENPNVREAFFPSGAHEYAVEPARAADGLAILQIAIAHEPPEAARLLQRWWDRLPGAFRVVRDRSGSVAGFYCMAERDELDAGWLNADPVTATWVADLRRDPVARHQRVLLLRRWLDREVGDAPCRVQAACWLDIKRVYMELRPHLRRLYTTTSSFTTYAPVITTLGFVAVSEGGAMIDGTAYPSAVLDFGPSSVDGWLTRLAAAELAVEENGLVDARTHQLLLDGKHVDLTKLEFEVLNYLEQHRGTVVRRGDLLADIWGYNLVGMSNVLAAIVVTLRRKLGGHASMLETVRGVGYRLRKD